MSDASIYDEDYFIRGQQSGKSLYKDYKWLPQLTMPMVNRIIEHCGIVADDKVLDFGCARGYIVKAFVSHGIDAFGCDISKWAIDNADSQISWRLTLKSPDDYKLPEMDWIIAKDVLEHVPQLNIAATLGSIGFAARKGIFIVVPLSKNPDERYVVPEYEKDVTHAIRWPLWRWLKECIACFGDGWELHASHRVRGVKDNYAQWTNGNGFITAKRIVS